MEMNHQVRAERGGGGGLETHQTTFRTEIIRVKRRDRRRPTKLKKHFFCYLNERMYNLVGSIPSDFTRVQRQQVEIFIVSLPLSPGRGAAAFRILQGILASLQTTQLA